MGKGGQFLQTHTLIGQEVKLGSYCQIRMLHPTENNPLIGLYYTMFITCPPLDHTMPVIEKAIYCFLILFGKLVLVLNCPL